MVPNLDIITEQTFVIAISEENASGILIMTKLGQWSWQGEYGSVVKWG